MKHFSFFKIKKCNKKKYIYLFIAFLLILTLYYDNRKYTAFIKNFDNNFDNHNYPCANNLIISEENTNPFKMVLFKNHLKYFFYDKLNSLTINLKNKKISDEEALLVLNNINNYKLIPEESIKNVYSLIDTTKESYTSYKKGINYYKDKNYSEALKSFNSVDSLDLYYTDSVFYSTLCKNQLKKDVLSQCDSLINKDYYTKALNLLDVNHNLFLETEFNTKVNEIKSKRQKYLNDKTTICEASSKALTTTISPSNINSLNITSNTDYLINVNIDKQKTYIYKNENSNWTLINTFPCSTGISGEDTPCGSFTIKERGKWFFSTKYNQGGKYWTQITGDILFHSLPYSQDQKTILDTTINKPSSHGCIRLHVNNAKWIYDNIPQNTKVVIK